MRRVLGAVLCLAILAAVLVLSGFDKNIPDSLAVMWRAAWTAELALLAGIKIKGKDD